MTDTVSYKESFEFIEALVAAGATPMQFKLVANNPHKAEDVVGLLAGQATLCWDNPLATDAVVTTSLALAQGIMGPNYHDPAKWASKCGFRLTKAHKEIFAVVPFSAELLKLCADTHILVPILKISIMQLHAKHNGYFYSKEDPWFAVEAFATERAEVGWVLVCRHAVPGSTNKTYDEQIAMLPEGVVLPTAAELLQALICHAVLSGERLLPDLYVRTNSVNSRGYRVDLGRFVADGLYVDYNSDCGRHSGLGVISSRKLK